MASESAETMDQRCTRVAHALGMEYTPVSWTDAARFIESDGQASCWGPHITDFVFTELEKKSRSYMLRYPNRNETVATIAPDDLMVIVGNHLPSDRHTTRSVSLKEYLQKAHTEFAAYTGLTTPLWNEATDATFSLSVQAVIVCGAQGAVQKNFVGQSYNYGRNAPHDPKGLVLAVTPYGTSLTQTRDTFTPSYQHMVRPGGVTEQYALQIARSNVAIGASQAAAQAEHVVVYMGIRGEPVGNMLIHVSLPLAQAPPPRFQARGGTSADYYMLAAAAAGPCGPSEEQNESLGDVWARGPTKRRLVDGVTTVGMVKLGQLVTASDAPPVKLYKTDPKRHSTLHGRVTLTLTFFLDGDRPTEDDVRKVIAQVMAYTQRASTQSGVVGTLQDLALRQTVDPVQAPILQSSSPPTCQYDGSNPWQQQA